MGKTPEDGDALAMQDTPPPEDLQFYYECSRRETWPHAIVKYGLLGLFVPVKVLVMVTMMVMLYVLCKLCLIGTHAPVKPGDPPLPRWRSNTVRTVGRFFARVGLLLLGFYWIQKRRRDRGVPDQGRPNVIVSNHLGYVDVLTLMAEMCPGFVAKREVLDIPFIGSIASAMQCVFVNRGSSTSRRDSVLLLQQRGENLDFPPVVIFPEGTTTSGKAVLRFQTGAFRSGVAVQVVGLSSPYRWRNAAWAESHGALHVLCMLCQLYNTMIVTTFPPYMPSEAEKRSARQYADGVQKYLASQLGVKALRWDLYDSPLLPFSRTRRRSFDEPMVQADAELAMACQVIDICSPDCSPPSERIVAQSSAKLAMPLAHATAAAATASPVGGFEGYEWAGSNALAAVEVV